jgi:hypothetical protein
MVSFLDPKPNIEYGKIGKEYTIYYQKIQERFLITCWQLKILPELLSEYLPARGCQ